MRRMGSRDMVVEKRPAEDRADTTARLSSYRRDLDALMAQRDKLLAEFPNQWVAVHDGVAYHAGELDSLFAELRLAGIEPARVPREFLTRDQPALLL